MKINPLLLRLILISFLLLSSWVILTSEANLSASDTLLKVGIMGNGTTMPDSVYTNIQSGGLQVEASQFMEIIGGTSYPISHFFHQDGLVVQYGRYISFARLGFAKGFVSLNMVDMVPLFPNKWVADLPRPPASRQVRHPDSDLFFLLRHLWQQHYRNPVFLSGWERPINNFRYNIASQDIRQMQTGSVMRPSWGMLSGLMFVMFSDMPLLYENTGWAIFSIVRKPGTNATNLHLP